ncbi:MAG TPA: zf-TFIIB domain-containing protein, partial [Polyangiaceae bacterium]|nr:zf-TFIIB domain-containing protein [Polyangiaceae bacterium]
PSLQAAQLQCPSCGGHLREGARACPYCRATVATLRCPSCSAWNLTSAHHCHTCGKGLDSASSTTQTTSTLACPRCQSHLVNRRYADLEVNECDQCGGLHIEPSMLDRIVQARDASTGLRLALPKREFQKEISVSYVRCPVCERMMNRQVFGRFSGIIVDVCRDHGVWFDAGELAEVLLFVSRGGLERARQREAEELRETARSARSEALRASMGREITQAGSLDSRGSGKMASLSGMEFIRVLRDIWRGLS